MESRFHGVPISAAQMAPKTAPSYSKTSGIRAPLTVDESDFECSISSKSHINSTSSSYYSGSELESEGFESDEDELETLSERPHVVEKEEEIVEETHFVKKLAFSGRSVRNPNEESARESGNVSGNAIFRPSVRIPDGIIYGGSRNFDDSDDSRSFLSESGDELIGGESYVVHYGDSRPLAAVLDEEVLESGPMPIVDVKVPTVQKLHIPIAQISADSDDDSRGSEVSEEEGFSGIVRVPSIEVLRRINSAPKVRISETDEDDDNELRAENIMKMEFVKDLAIGNLVIGLPNEKEHIGVENSVHCVISADMIQVKGPDIDKEATANSLVVTEEFNSTSEQGQNADGMHLDEQIQKTNVIDDPKHYMDFFDHIEMSPETISEVASAAEPECLCGGVMLTKSQIGEMGSNSKYGVASLEQEYIKSSNTGLEDNLILNPDNESEKVESESEHEIDQTVESFSYNDAKRSSSAHICVDIKEVTAKWCPEFQESPKVLTDSLQIYMSDSISKVACFTSVTNVSQTVYEGSKLDQETRKEAENSYLLPDDVDQPKFHGDTEELVAEMSRIPDSTSLSSGEILLDNSQEIDGQFVTDFHDEVDADSGISDHGEIIDPAALTAFIEAARDAVSGDGFVKLKSLDGIGDFPLESNLVDPSSFSSARSVITGRSSDSFVPPSTNGELEEVLSESEKKKIEKIQQIRVKYLHLLHILRRSPVDYVASEVLYQLTLAEESSSHASHLNPTTKAAMELEAQKNVNLEFSVCILVIGKTGVGKSATINSIFGERKAETDAFEPATTNVKEISGIVDGVKIKVFDTPGLRTSLIDQSINRKILLSIKKLIKKYPPDIILYVDRLDLQTNNHSDLPLLRSVTSYLGSSIWRKSIVAFTHGTSIPPDGPDGHPLSYELFVAQQSQAIQQLISHSTGELLLMNLGSMIPVCLIENHPSAEKNGHGEIVLRNGESWRFQLLFLCYSMKTLSELCSMAKVPNPMDHRKRPPVLSYIFSSFLQANIQSKLSNDQGGENVVSDVELYSSSDSGQDVIEYDNLPPFKPQNNSQDTKLSRDQMNAYFEVCDYPIKLLQKKQLREEMRRLRNLTKLGNGVVHETFMDEAVDQEKGAPETVAVPLSDLALPHSFDGDSPFRYHLLEPYSRLLTRPVLNSRGWDHDCVYDGVVIEDKTDFSNHFPAIILVKLTKDKKEFTIQLHPSVLRKHWDKGSTMAGLDILTLGKIFACTLKGETKNNFIKNEIAAGLSINFVGEHAVSGIKIEDHFVVGKRFFLVGKGGIVQSHDDATFGVNLDLRRRDEDCPTGQYQTSLGLSIIRYRGHLICGCYLQSQFSVSRNLKLNVTTVLNNKQSGQISIKASCSDQLQIAVLALVPIARAVLKKIFQRVGEDYLA